jgi:hypothetical protein
MQTLPVAESSLKSKLASLIKLGGGMIALPAVGIVVLPSVTQAQIEFHDSVNFTVGFNAGAGENSIYVLPMPGSNQLLFAATATKSTNVRAIVMGGTFAPGLANARQQASIRTYDVGGRAFVKRGNGGLTFSNVGAHWNVAGTVMAVDHAGATHSLGAGAFSEKYIAFVFKDTTHSDQIDYGWIKVSGAVSGLNPSLTIESWAYRTDGQAIAMGATAVPEPQSAAVATGAALVLGATGLRAWRKRQTAKVS